MAARTKKGRRTTGHDAVATIRLSSELRESVDAWAAMRPTAYRSAAMGPGS